MELFLSVMILMYDLIYNYIPFILIQNIKYKIHNIKYKIYIKYIIYVLI